MRDVGIVVGLIVAVLGWVAVFGAGDPPDTQHPTVEPAATEPVVASSEASAEPPAPAPGEPVETRVVELQRGDTLVGALLRVGVDHGTGHTIAIALRAAGVNLRRLKPGEPIEITVGPAGEPRAIRWRQSPWLAYAVTPSADGWVASREETTPEVRVTTVAGRVERSLFEAVEAASETPQLVLAIVRIFEWEFDFTADTRPGDRFRLLVEKRYAGDTFVEYGRVLAAQYLNDGRPITGVGYTPRSGGRFQFYDLEGRSLKKSFLKSPLEFTRITSGFAYARPHPILGGVRPHLAIDYAAPAGTPVRAVADGVVLRAGRNGGNGISVRLRHRRGYETMYNHLSKLGPGIRRGARVSQRQVIGRVGSTGLSTGPHLDYRVIKDGRFVNPLHEKFLPGEPIAAKERAAYLTHARDLVERLEREAPL